MDVVGVGVPVVNGPAAGWNFWPLIGIPFALLLAFRWLRLPRRAGVVMVAILFGLVTADAISSWGVIPVLAVALPLAMSLAIVLRRMRRNPPPTV